MKLNPKLQAALLQLTQRSTVLGLLGTAALLFGVTLDPQHLDAITGVVSAVASCALVFFQEQK